MPRAGQVVTIPQDFLYGLGAPDDRYEVESERQDSDGQWTLRLIYLDSEGKREKGARGHFRRRSVKAEDVEVV